MLRQEASPLSVRGAGTRSAGGMNSLSSADRLPGQMVEKNRNAYWRLTAATFKCSRETPDLAVELEIHLTEQSFFFFFFYQNVFEKVNVGLSKVIIIILIKWNKK